MEGYLETFRYDKGDIDELKDRALFACAFLSELKGWKSRAMEIAKDIMDGEDEKDVAKDLRYICDQILKNTSDDDSYDWNGLYTALFGDSLFIQESQHIPQNDEIGKLVRQCIRDKVKVKNDIPEGSIA